MKAAGIVLIIVGLLMTFYTGFAFVTKEKVVDIGSVEITKDKEHDIQWQPYAGIAAIVIGGGVLFSGRKK